jgi:hypothetical protein
VAIGLDAIWIDVHDQAADFAAGSFADRHEGKGRGTPPGRPAPWRLQGLRRTERCANGKRSPARSL